MKLVNTYKQVILWLPFLVIGQLSFAQSLTLSQCIDTAQKQNKNLQIARNNMDASAIKQKEAKANLLPRLTANGDYKYFTNIPYQLLPQSTFNPAAPEGQFNEAQFGVPHNITANLQLVIPLYNPQIYGGIEASKVASELTDLQYQKSEEQIFFEIANLYYNAQILQTQITFLDSNLVNANRLLGNLKLLQEQLLTTGTDVGKIELQMSQLSIQKNTAESKQKQVLQALKFTLGIPLEQPFDINYTIAATEETVYDYKLSLDSKLIQAQNKLLQTELKTLNKSRYLPTVNLIGSYGTTGFGYDEKPNEFLNFYPLGFAGLQVSYPIFNGTTTLRKVNQKQIELTNNELKINLIQDQNTMQIANAELERLTMSESIETSKQQIQLAQKIYNNTILQQKQGVASLTEVLLADNALREAQQINVSAIIDYLKADLELKKLTGNLR